MERNGLLVNRDYTTALAGGVLPRCKDLIAKKHAVTMLIAPLDVMAKASGVNLLRKVCTSTKKDEKRGSEALTPGMLQPSDTT